MSSAASRLSIVGEVAIADEPFVTTFEERVHVRRARHPTGGLRRGWRHCSLRPSSFFDHPRIVDRPDVRPGQERDVDPPALGASWTICSRFARYSFSGTRG